MRLNYKEEHDLLGFKNFLSGVELVTPKTFQ